MSHAAPETGEFCLLLYLAIVRRSLPLLKETLKDIAQTCTDPTVKWILRQTRSFLTPQQGDWLDGAMRKLYEDPDNSQNRSPYSYLWQPAEGEALSKEVHTRLTRREDDRLKTIAQTKGMSRAAIAREALRRYLAEAV